jgi:uncharacterized protein (DUF2267 family)
MSATGLEVFDKTVQTTNIWLDDIMAELGPDRHVAWHVLGAVLRTLRDRLPIELTAHLSAELPILVRGAYYDQWRPHEEPVKLRTREEFLERIEQGLKGTRPVNPAAAAKVVFQVLNRHLAAGLIEKARGALPEPLRELWPAASGTGKVQSAA